MGYVYTTAWRPTKRQVSGRLSMCRHLRGRIDLVSGDELLVFMGSLGIAAYGWVAWVYWLGAVQPHPRHSLWSRWLLTLVPVGCFGALWYVLRTAASFDVRDSSEYLALYSVLGLAWLSVSMYGLSWLGVSARDDAIERGNTAAAIVVSALLVAVTAGYAGANIGDGPGWWCVVFAGGLALASLTLSWLVLNAGCDVADRITIDRDTSLALRIGGLLAGCGLIFGRGAAGDWTSEMQTVIEFAAAWPALLLLTAGLGVERALGNRYRMPPGVAALLGALYLGMGILAVEYSSPLPQNPAYPGPPAVTSPTW